MRRAVCCRALQHGHRAEMLLRHMLKLWPVVTRAILCIQEGPCAGDVILVWFIARPCSVLYLMVMTGIPHRSCGMSLLEYAPLLLSLFSVFERAVALVIYRTFEPAPCCF